MRLSVRRAIGIAPAMLMVAAYPPVWRPIAAVLMALSGAAMPVVLVWVLVADDPPITTLGLVLLVAAALLPAALVVVGRRACAMRLSVEPETIALRRSGLQIDVPHAAISRLQPWALPLPEPGLSIQLRSGRTLRYRVGFEGDPSAMLRELARAEVESAEDAARHPTIVYAAARGDRRRRWPGWIGKFVLFSLIPAAVLFNAHQWIAYGGTFGEYYLLGAASYARTAATYWLTVALYLVLFAATWRVAAELVALASAWVVPQRAGLMRRLAEHTVAVGYYGGVLALLALRFYG